MGELGIESNSPNSTITTKQLQDTTQDLNGTPCSQTSQDHLKKLKSEECITRSDTVTSTTTHSTISIVLPNTASSLSCSTESCGKTETNAGDISRDPSMDSLGISMELEVDENQTDFLRVGAGGLDPRSRTESTYLRPEELPPSKDEDTAKYRSEAMVSVMDVLSSEVKTSQGLLDSPSMIFLRALFDVPKGADDYKAIAKWVMTLFQTNNKLMNLMQVAIRQEVQCTCIDALFRENTMVCTLASSFLKITGSSYLRLVLGPPIAKMAQTKKSYEIDLHKPGGAKTNEKRVRKLVSELLKGIFESSSRCPPTIREFLFYMRSEIRDRYSSPQADCTVRSFFFLRFVCPTIVNPRENGAINKYPTAEAKRGLCIAARIVQTLANDGECDPAQCHLEKLNRVITDNRANMRKYIEGLSNKLVTSKEATQETDTAYLSRKLAVEELQKYMYHKIKSLPANPSAAEQVKNQAIVKLRRAIQACNRGNNLYVPHNISNNETQDKEKEKH